MNQSYPVPPPELVEQWREEACPFFHLGGINDLAAKAAQWGADQELESCCKWLPKLPPWSADDLRRHRRPEPPSLKERALQAWAAVEAGTDDQAAMTVIRRALEQLPDAL